MSKIWGWISLEFFKPLWTVSTRTWLLIPVLLEAIVLDLDMRFLAIAFYTTAIIIHNRGIRQSARAHMQNPGSQQESILNGPSLASLLDTVKGER